MRLITGRTAKLLDDAKPARRHKYNAKRTQVGEHWFDSKAEANRYEELLMLERANAISRLELQPMFILQDPFMHKGKRIRSIKYIADFKYTQDGHIVYEDVKGRETDVFKLKYRMFLNLYPDIELRLVK